MRKIIKYVVGALLFTIISPTFACVSMGISHTCNRDCENYPSVLYVVCIYGGEQYK